MKNNRIGARAAQMKWCKWDREETDSNCWATDCGNAFEINEGAPKENEMTFCCFCGHPIDAIDSDER